VADYGGGQAADRRGSSRPGDGPGVVSTLEKMLEKPELLAGEETSMNIVIRAIVSMAASVAVVGVLPSVSAAQPVEYVRVCDAFGTGFYYLPGTDTCVNPALKEARVETAGGTWLWRFPTNDRSYVKNAKQACKGGKLLSFGTITPDGLVLTDFGRFETTAQLPFTLEPNKYISAVVYEGGFTGPARDFCMFYTWTDGIPLERKYQPIGCLDIGPGAVLPFVSSFSPDSPLRPVTTAAVSIVGAGGQMWSSPDTTDYAGSLTVSLCVQTLK